METKLKYLYRFDEYAGYDITNDDYGINNEKEVVKIPEENEMYFELKQGIENKRQPFWKDLVKK